MLAEPFEYIYILDRKVSSRLGGLVAQKRILLR